LYFAKTPKPGKVKTRMLAAVSPKIAAALPSEWHALIFCVTAEAAEFGK